MDVSIQTSLLVSESLNFTRPIFSFNRPYSEKTAEAIDGEVHKMITEQYERAKAILREHKEGHAELAKILIEKEVIFAEDVEKIFGAQLPLTATT